MDKIEKAIFFATQAHQGQKRKQKNVDMIYHPFTCGMILQRNGCDENVVSAGILHDVVEDTKYTFEDIEKEFGKEIRDYVYDASEPDKSLEWIERKKHTIEHIKNAPLESKLIVACDKINNLEDALSNIEIDGKDNVLSRNPEEQKWYYISVYKSCIENVDKEHPIFKRYKSVLEKVFKEEIN